MTESNGNMYEGVITWNPLAGECSHGCSYCSTNALKRYPGVAAKYSGDIRLTEDLLKKFKGGPKTIFVVAQNDLFAWDVPNHCIEAILNACNVWNQNTYLFQTKNPDRFHYYFDRFPQNTILCTTIETNRDYPQMGKTPGARTRAESMEGIFMFPTQVTIEPIMDFDHEEMCQLIRLCEPDQVNIGADSKRNGLPEPSKAKIEALIRDMELHTKVVIKKNLYRLLK